MTPEPSPAGASLGKLWLKVVLSLLIAGAFVWTLRRGGLPLLPDRAALARVSVPHCAFYFLLLFAWYFIRAARWRHLLHAVAPGLSTLRVVAVSCVGYGAILVLPLRAGEFVRPYLIRDRDRLSMATAMGTIGAERIVDGLMLTLLLGVCLQLSHPLDPLPDHIGRLQIPVVAVPAYSYAALTAFVGAFGAMLVFHLKPVLGRTLVERTLGLVSRSLAARASEFVARLAEGLNFLRSPRHVGPFLIESVLYWSLNALGIMVLARGCGLQDVTFAQACVVMGVLGIGIVVPAGPGLFGAFQASTYAALAMFHRDDVVLGPGAAFVFLLYAFQGAWHVLAAAVFMVVERRTRPPLNDSTPRTHPSRTSA